MEEGPKASVSVDVDKQLLLKFKSMCVLKEVTMSEEIEKMIKEWVEKNKNSMSIQSQEPLQLGTSDTAAPAPLSETPGTEVSPAPSPADNTPIA